MLEIQEYLEGIHNNDVMKHLVPEHNLLGKN